MTGILFSQMEPPPELEGAFHDWYESEHIPIRLALPGFERARRYAVVRGAPRYLAVYDISDLDVFGSPAFQAIKTAPSPRTRTMLASVSGFTRYVCEQLSDTGPAEEGLFLSVNAFKVPERATAAFDDWYELEHTPRLMEAADWLRVRRFRVVDADDDAWTHLALHEIASIEAMDSPERARARAGPRRDELAREPWFGASGRWLYGLIYDSAARASTPRMAGP